MSREGTTYTQQPSVFDRQWKHRILAIGCWAFISPALAQPLTRGSWQAPPAPVDAPVVPLQHVRVIDYGDDYIWHVGGDYFRNAPERKGPESRGHITNIDVDGDGRSEGDCISYLTFSMDNPINPTEPYWDSAGNQALFYGGVTGFFADNKGKSGFSELQINVHETPDGDNLSVHTFGTKERHRNYHVFIWKKEDFYYGGDKHRVSIDDSSELVLHVMRGFAGMDDARFVLVEGDLENSASPGKFYISEYNFGTMDVKTKFQASKEGLLITLNPTETRWAEYSPEAPYNIVFERENATYEKRQFNDVHAAGYYIAKHEWRAEEQGCKTYAFELFATVHRPARRSETLAMSELRPMVHGIRTPPFYISRTEIPYSLWYRVRRRAVAQMYGHEDYYPYMTDRDGDMGSMDFLPKGAPVAHTADEPVTDITWLDAVAWCNMLSEHEGREPCYYFTPNFDTVFRRVRERRMHQRNEWYVPKVYVKWEADGYRLPTTSEWLVAAGTPQPDTSTGSPTSSSTHPVGSTTPNTFGLHDMLGNVWELVWDQGESYDEAKLGENIAHTVLGGSFLGEQVSASAYGDVPYTGNFNIGFRVVRRKKGLYKPDLQSEIAELKCPAWRFGKGEKQNAGDLDYLSKDEPLLDMVAIPEGKYTRWDTARIFTSPFNMARHEISYAKWKRVYDWAVARGYEFNKDGDMGSMDHDIGRHAHGPQEPVTDITRFDAILFCNALSEMEKRKPCYYAGSGGMEVIRKAHQYRRIWTHLPAKYKEPQFGELNYEVFQRLDKLSNWNCAVDWSADGYRLPTMAEWIVACKATTTSKWFWGEDYAGGLAYMWCAENSEGKTQPVGTLAANAFGLHDIHGNVYEMCWGQDAGGKGQEFHETWNPKGPVEWRGEQLHHVVRGGSFRYSEAWGKAFQPDGTGKPVRCFSLKGYPEIGFRPVRCEARTHRSSGTEMPEDIQVLDVNLQEAVTPLQGATHRGNLQRTGVHHTRGVPMLTGLKWKFKTNGPIAAQPIVLRGVAYIHCNDSFVYAIKTEDGSEMWRYKTAGGPVARNTPSPTIKDGIMYLTSEKAFIYALDIRTGRPKWKTTVRGGTVAAGSPVPVYGAVFTWVSAYTQEGGFLALHGETGQVLTIYRNDMWGAWQTWAFADGKVIMSNHVGHSLLDLKTGARRSTGPGLAPNYNIPVVCEGKIYTVGGNVAASDYRSAKTLYIKSLEGTDQKLKSNESREAICENSLAFWNDTIYFGTRTGHLHAHDAMTGRQIWKAKLGERIRSAPSVSTPAHDSQEAIAYVGTDGGHLFAVDATSGEKLWDYEADGDKIRSDPWIEDGVVYFGSDGGFLYAVE